MPIPSTVNDLSQTAANNSPPGSESPTTADDYLRQHAAFLALHRDGKGFSAPVSIAAAATTDIGAQNAFAVEITGTATITSLGTSYNGPRFLRFTGPAVLTHSATLTLPGAANITTVAGDTAIAYPNSAGNGWNVVQFMRAAAAPVSADNLGLRNKIINGNPLINQRGVSSASTAYAAGVYFLDRWKAGAGGATLSFATVDNVVTITVTAGSIIQVVEGLSLQTGTYTLSWSGTAQGKIGAGAFSASGVTGSITGGTNTNIEFNTGTVSLVQLEFGSVATPFEHRPYGQELLLCQRYGAPAPEVEMGASGVAANIYAYRFNFLVPMRASPTPSVAMTFTNANGTAAYDTSLTTAIRVTFTVTATGGFTFVRSNTPFFSAEL